MTDTGLESTSLGIQIFGGHGYIREWGMEQLMRDVRIAMLYEGTNGIQSLDLIGRKLTRDRGDMLGVTRNALAELVEAMADGEAQQQASALLNEWYQTSLQVKTFSAVEAAGGACDYLAYSGYCLLGVLWYSMADCAAQSDNPVLAAGKQKTCDFYLQRILPRTSAHKAAMLAPAETLLALQGSEFDYL